MRTLVWAVFLFLGLVLLVEALVALGSPMLLACDDGSQQKAPNYGKERQPSPGAIAFADGRRGLGCVGHWIDANHDDVGAASTSVIAIFTVTLWWSTRRLGIESQREMRLLRKSIWVASQGAKAARRSALAAERTADVAVAVEQPIFVIENVTIQQGQPTYKIEIGNHGRTSATITSDCLALRITSELPRSPRYPLNATKQVRKDRIIDRERSYHIERGSSVSDDDWNDLRKGNGKTLWAYGYLDYVDFTGTERRYGFCIGFRPARITPAEKLYVTMAPTSFDWDRAGPVTYSFNRPKEQAQAEQSAAEAAEAIKETGS